MKTPQTPNFNPYSPSNLSNKPTSQSLNFLPLGGKNPALFLKIPSISLIASIGSKISSTPDVSASSVAVVRDTGFQKTFMAWIPWDLARLDEGGVEEGDGEMLGDNGLPVEAKWIEADKMKKFKPINEAGEKEEKVEGGKEDGVGKLDVCWAKDKDDATVVDDGTDKPADDGRVPEPLLVLDEEVYLTGNKTSRDVHCAFIIEDTREEISNDSWGCLDEIDDSDNWANNPFEDNEDQATDPPDDSLHLNRRNP